jgi:GNAT superfamily N-acetyltransferase
MRTDGLNGDILLRPYAETDWESMRLFIFSQWGLHHPMADRSLFDWQFRGFGHAREALRSILLFVDGRLAGFRGLIPGLYQVPFRDGMRILPGASLAMWMIDPEFRGRGLGRIMHGEAERLCPVLTGAGSNPRTSVPIYLQSGFEVLDAMHRHVAVLEAEKCRARFGERSAKIRPVSLGRTRVLHPSAPEPELLAEIWRGSAFEAGFFSLFRDGQFWRWRILESPGFRYGVFVDPEGSGFLTARVEPLVDPLSKAGDSGSVLRVIDLVPASPATWNGAPDVPFGRFLAGCLAWARETGCIAADHHCSSGVFGPLLEASGFVAETLPGEKAPLLPRIFNGEGPGRPINALARAPVPVSFERTCMVKSDNDMDRPRRLDENGKVVY